ncbi:MAG: hypothetical protein WD830_06980 [Chloroflexota bacterium]
MTDQTRFAHASEAELARILDYYGVHWEYEPRTFPILWNTDGKVVESFSPDFFLSELEIYVELTTLKQNLVRRKNRKLRRLRELYPDIRVKLFYGKDFRALMLKYGRFDLAASLSGLEGQLMPERLAQPSLAIAIPAVPVAEAPIDTAQPGSVDPVEKPAQPVKPARRARPSRGTRRRRGRRAFIAEDS